MNRITKVIAFLLVLALLVTSAIVAFAADTKGVNELPRADDASGSTTGVPDYALQTIAGSELRLSGLRGKPVLLDFFSATCQHCQAHAPFVADLARRHKNLTVINLAANNPFVESEKVEAYRRDAKIENTIVYAPSELFALYLTPDENGVIGVPQAVLFDSSGKLVARFTKWQDTDKPNIEATIAKHLKQEPEVRSQKPE